MANYTDSALADFLRFQRQRAKESHKKRIGLGTMTSWESSEILVQFDAAASRLTQLASMTALQAQFMDLVLRIDPTATPAPAEEPATKPVRMRTGEQWERITKLLNHHSFTRADRTKGLLKVNELTQDAAVVYIAELEAALPSAEQVARIETLLVNTSNSEADYEQGRQKLAKLDRAGAAAYIVELEQLASASAQPESTHPALAPSPYDQARAAYIAALKHPHIESDERDKAMSVIDEWTEGELRKKTNAVLNLIRERQNAPAAASVAA